MRENPRANGPSDGPAGLASLAAGLVHDIRNPLTSIKTFASVLRVRKDQPGFLERFERSMTEGIARIEVLLDDLADLTGSPRPGDPAGENMAPVILPDLLSHCFSELGEELALRGIARNLSVGEGLLPATGHAGRLRRAILSLLRFSAQKTGPGGTLTVCVEPGEAGTLAINITNDGPGITAEHLPYVFEPYYSTGKERGAGLSLALARKIVLEHGGKVGIASKPGPGFTIRILLPVWP